MLPPAVCWFVCLRSVSLFRLRGEGQDAQRRTARVPGSTYSTVLQYQRILQTWRRVGQAQNSRLQSNFWARPQRNAVVWCLHQPMQCNADDDHWSQNVQKNFFFFSIRTGSYRNCELCVTSSALSLFGWRTYSPIALLDHDIDNLFFIVCPSFSWLLHHEYSTDQLKRSPWKW